jgi:sugar phosphate isomerase/epimerase
MDPWRFAVYSHILPRLTPVDAVPVIRDAGYSGIWLQVQSSTPPLDGQPSRINANNRGHVEPSSATLARVAEVCASHGVSITGLAFEPDPEAPGDIARAIALARVAGAPQVRLRPATLGEHSYQATVEHTRRLCKSYVTAAAGSGVRVVLQQHWGTVAPSATQLHHVLRDFDARDLGCIYDPGSMTVEGYELYRIGLELLGDYVADVHIKNARFFRPEHGGVWEWEWSKLSDGLIDLRAVFGALRAAGYRGWITLTDESEGPDERTMLEANRLTLLQAIAEAA